jgi:hypothetical protein
MKPLVFTAVVERPRRQVYEHLADLRNHEPFTDHFLVDWEGDAHSVRVRVKAPGRSEVVDITEIEAAAPTTLAERTTGAGGKRTSTGTYTLEEDGPSRTRVRFEFVVEKMPAYERPLLPLTKAWVKRVNGKALERLPAALEAAIPAEPAAA